jgi:hypothetical protein
MLRNTAVGQYSGMSLEDRFVPVSAALGAAKPCQQPRGSGAHKKTDEVRDQRNRPDDPRIVVSRTVEQVLCSVADGDGSANRYQRQNGPLSDRDTKCQA